LLGYIDKLNARLDNVDRRVEELGPLPPFIASMFDYSRTLIVAERDWMQNFVREMEAGNV
jgi:hypothetical protein